MRFSLCFLCLLGSVVLGCDLFPNDGEEQCGCDDGNECTLDLCVGDGCETEPREDGWECALNGTSGVCVSGECVVNLCESVVCNDGNECTEGACDYVDGRCVFSPVSDGEPCGNGGYCLAGECTVLVDRCTDNDLAAIETGEEPDRTALAQCAQLAMPADNLLACLDDITECLEDAGTTLTTECSSCFALLGCCMVDACAACWPGPGDACDACIEESCQTRVDICVGGH
jgi:hypothetical protein